MKRSKYLRNNGLMSMVVGFGLLIFAAEQQVFIPYMLILAGLSLWIGVRELVAASVLRDEEEEIIERLKY